MGQVLERDSRSRLALAWLAGASLAVTLVVGAPTTSLARGGSPSTASTRAYPWPLAPFNRAHPVRAVFGDPRTTFLSSVNGNPLAGAGKFSFHFGIDIDAPNGTAVYPVVSGTASLYDDDGVLVTSSDGRRFIYIHIVPSVRPGQAVTAGRTVLGHVTNWAQELHFTELSAGGATVDPLLPGHLTPYRDTTRPTVAAVIARDARGNALEPFDVHGRITLSANAADMPMTLQPRTTRGYAVTHFVRDHFSVVPAALTWSLTELDGRTVVPLTTVVDFRRGLPPQDSFWQVYARGTYQNRAPIVPRYHKLLPGRYLFRITGSAFDTRTLRDGVYVLVVTAVDVRGNRGSLAQRIEVRNGVLPR